MTTDLEEYKHIERAVLRILDKDDPEYAEVPNERYLLLEYEPRCTVQEIRESKTWEDFFFRAVITQAVDFRHVRLVAVRDMGEAFVGTVWDWGNVEEVPKDAQKPQSCPWEYRASSGFLAVGITRLSDAAIDVKAQEYQFPYHVGNNNCWQFSQWLWRNIKHPDWSTFLADNGGPERSRDIVYA